MSETINFIQGSKRNYDSSTMQGGVYFSKDSKEIFLNGESYGNAVPADEEDLTQVNGALQLKDREVNADNFQSKGYVILRKNLVQQGDGSYKNILTQDMISQSNTTYEIRYDFDLNNVEITIQSNCTLKFEGGSLNNGTLCGNKTEITSQMQRIFTNMSFSGTFNSCSLVEWFGAELDHIGSKFITEYIGKGTYPDLNQFDVGTEYFDISSGRKVYWNGKLWVDNNTEQTIIE